MDNLLDRLSRNLAENLTQLRRSRGLTQAALAERAGLPRSTLTYLESGEGNPSLANLSRIAAALQVSIEELLAKPRGPIQLIKAPDIPPAGKGKVTIFRLLPDPIPGLMMERMEFASGGIKGGVPHLSGTKEYLTCVQGRLRVRVGGETFDVEKGDVLAFPGDQPHAYENQGPSRAVCISVVALAPVGV